MPRKTTAIGHPTGEGGGGRVVVGFFFVIFFFHGPYVRVSLISPRANGHRERYDMSSHGRKRLHDPKTRKKTAIKTAKRYRCVKTTSLTTELQGRAQTDGGKSLN